ncbi:MAG: molybdenum cofactor biosynthesis protein MoaE [Gammaproteobacteria bacterium]
MEVKLCSEFFEPWAEIQAHQGRNPGIAGACGATAVFIGTMRDFNEGDEVVKMTLEHYPGMTEKLLEEIVAEAEARWRVINSLVVHRVGDILPGDPIVLVAVWASHRGDAFDACRHIMEALKSRAPFWKKERLTSEQERWVEKNTDGYRKS